VRSFRKTALRNFEEFARDFSRAFPSLPYEQYPTRCPESFDLWNHLLNQVRSRKIELKLVQAAYDVFPYCNYKTDFDLLRTNLLRIIDFIPLDHIERVLSVGCGSCVLESFMATCLLRDRLVLGVDLSSRMLRAGVGLIPGRELVRVTKADASMLPVGDASVDLVLSFSALHWLPNFPRGLSEIQRILRQGGYAFLTFNEVGFGRELEWRSHLEPAASVVLNEHEVTDYPNGDRKVYRRLVITKV